MRLPETEKMGLQHPDHQFKSGCRLLGIIERWFLFLCEKPSIYAGFRALVRFWGGEIHLENFIVNFRWKPLKIISGGKIRHQ